MEKIIANEYTEAIAYQYSKQAIVNLEQTCKGLEDVTTNEIYWHFVTKFSLIPTSEKKWNEKVDFIIDETMFNLIYVNGKELTTDTSIQNLQFKVTHRIMACNYNLKIWKIKPTDQCDYCQESDTIEHHLVDCKVAKNFWKKGHKY